MKAKKLNEVIQAMECCHSANMSCSDNCPYFKGYDLNGCMDDLEADVLQHLKEYEAKMSTDGSDTYANR